jgi:hypothetical protein
MQKKSEIELAKAERAEIIRSLTRLKYRLLANREINSILPDSLMEFERSLQSGELLEINLSEALDVTSKTS